MVDYTVVNYGSLFVLRGNTVDAVDHLRANVSSETQWVGPDAIAVEPRYIAPLVSQLREEGFEV